MPLSFVHAPGSHIIEREISHYPGVLTSPLGIGILVTHFTSLLKIWGVQPSFCIGGKKGANQAAIYGYMSIYDSKFWFDISNKDRKNCKYIRPELMLLIRSL